MNNEEQGQPVPNGAPQGSGDQPGESAGPPTEDKAEQEQENADEDAEYVKTSAEPNLREKLEHQGEPEPLTDKSPLRRHFAENNLTIGSMFELLSENALNKEAIQFVKDKWERPLSAITKAQQEWFKEILAKLIKLRAAAEAAEKDA